MGPLHTVKRNPVETQIFRYRTETPYIEQNDSRTIQLLPPAFKVHSGACTLAPSHLGIDADAIPEGYSCGSICRRKVVQDFESFMSPSPSGRRQ